MKFLVSELAFRRIFKGWRGTFDDGHKYVWHECVECHVWSPRDGLTLLADRTVHILKSQLEQGEIVMGIDYGATGGYGAEVKFKIEEDMGDEPDWALTKSCGEENVSFEQFGAGGYTGKRKYCIVIKSTSCYAGVDKLTVMKVGDVAEWNKMLGIALSNLAQKGYVVEVVGEFGFFVAGRMS